MRPKRVLFLILAAAAFALSFVVALKSAPAEERFDSRVRADFYTGFAGNKDALARGMKACEEALAADPKNAEAMVWHGAGTYFQAGMAFRGGDTETGMDLYRKGLDEMADAIQLDPDDIAVRSARGGIVIQSTLFMEGNPEREQLIQTAMDDYRRIYDVQKEQIDKLSAHSRGELLSGIASGYRQLGQEAKAREWYQRVADEMKGTPYGARAQKYLDKGTLTPMESVCLGCHTAAH